MDDMERVVLMMTNEMGREPTEKELYEFVYGNDKDRARIMQGAKQDAN